MYKRRDKLKIPEFYPGTVMLIKKIFVKVFFSEFHKGKKKIKNAQNIIM